MVQLSLWIGLLLIALGIVGYVGTQMISITALIPAAFGVVIVLAALYGRAESRRRTAMHLAMGIALVGILGSIPGVGGRPRRRHRRGSVARASDGCLADRLPGDGHPLICCRAEALTLDGRAQTAELEPSRFEQRHQLGRRVDRAAPVGARIHMMPVVHHNDVTV